MTDRQEGTFTSGGTSDGSLTSEILTSMVRDLLDAQPTSRFVEPDLFGIRAPTLFGMKVVEVPPDIRPKLRIRDEVPCTEPFRSEMNAWLLQMFGTRDYSPFARGTALMWNGGIAMRSEDVLLLKNLG